MNSEYERLTGWAQVFHASAMIAILAASSAVTCAILDGLWHFTSYLLS